MNKLAELHNAHDLVLQFAAVGVEQFAAEAAGRTKTYNQLFDKMAAISQKLRDDDGRGALAELYNHPNPQVRLKAAIHTLAIFPIEARRVLQDIVDKREYPQAGEARGMLRALQRGTYVPD